jgi:hypothetical protein
MQFKAMMGDNQQKPEEVNQRLSSFEGSEAKGTRSLGPTWIVKAHSHLNSVPCEARRINVTGGLDSAITKHYLQ